MNGMREPDFFAELRSLGLECENPKEITKRPKTSMPPPPPPMKRTCMKLDHAKIAANALAREREAMQRNELARVREAILQLDNEEASSSQCDNYYYYTTTNYYYYYWTSLDPYGPLRPPMDPYRPLCWPRRASPLRRVVPGCVALGIR